MTPPLGRTLDPGEAGKVVAAKGLSDVGRTEEQFTASRPREPAKGLSNASLGGLPAAWTPSCSMGEGEGPQS